MIDMCARRSRRRLKKRAALFVATRGGGMPPPMSMDMQSSPPPHDASGVTGASEHVTYRRHWGVRDDRYPALLDKAPAPAPPTCSSGNVRNSLIGDDDVEKLYDFTAGVGGGGVGGTDACPRAVVAADYAPAVERAASTLDVGGGGTLQALFGADRLYQSAAALACPLCVHHATGSTSLSGETFYVERRRRADHDVDCPLHVDKSPAPVGRRNRVHTSDRRLPSPAAEHCHCYSTTTRLSTCWKLDLMAPVGRWYGQDQSDMTAVMYPPGLRSPDQLVTADNCVQRRDLNVVSRSQ